MSPRKFSSSSSTIASRANPSSRNSEISNPMRRSFSGNPFSKPSIVANPRSFNPVTPANSPSDYPRRNSIGRENPVSLRDNEDKENGKDPNLKPGRVRSPSLSKGPKNFMSPTISAASKIAPSPKKKILVEKNESPRTSVSFSDGKGPPVEDTDSKIDMGLSQKNHIEDSYDSTVTDLDPVGGDPLDSKASENEEDLNSKASLSNFKNESQSLSETMPPYDPKTNYLSPRPQFLHYRPNPRIENYLNKEESKQRLEESFISESFSSDTEGTEETQSEVSHKESEDVSSVEMVKEEEEESEEEELQVPEPKPISKRRFFTGSKFAALILVLLFGFLSVSVTDYPIVDHSGFKDFYIPPEISEVGRENFEWVAQNVRQWSCNSLSYLSNLIRSLMKAQKLGPLQFYNLTGVPEDFPVDGYVVFDRNDRRGGEKLENVEIEEGENSEDDSEEDGPEEYEEEEEHAVIETIDEIEVNLNQDEVIEPNSSDDPDPVHTDLQLQRNIDLLEDSIPPISPEAVQTQEEVDPAVHIDKEIQSNIDSFEESITVLQAPDIQPDASEAGESESIEYNEAEGIPDIQPDASEAGESESIEYNAAEGNPESPELDALIAKPQSSETIDLLEESVPEATESQREHDMTSCAQIEHNEEDALTAKSQSAETVDVVMMPNERELSTLNVLGISVLVLILIATTTVFLYGKKAKSPALNVAIPMDQTKKFDISPKTASDELCFYDRPSSRVWPTEVDMHGESCPSEMSSFQRSSSYSKKGLKGSNEAQSHERKPGKNYRRESLASSEYSMGSHSYGSFTTYEKIPVKHAVTSGEEEMITPVRRSSRLRNQVTSP